VLCSVFKSMHTRQATDVGMLGQACLRCLHWVQRVQVHMHVDSDAHV
jgi:hypothetical protein